MSTKHRQLFLKTMLVAVCIILIAGNAYAEWWNSAWPYKRCFSIGTNHSAIDTGYTFVASNINTSLWSDTNDLSFTLVDENLLTELDLNYTGPIGSRTFKWRASHNMPANGEDRSYCIYYGNNSRATPPKRDPKNIYAIYDDFEDGDYTNGVNWVEMRDAAGRVIVQSSTVKEGTYSLKLTQSSNADVMLGTPDSTIIGIFEGWIRTTNIGAGANPVYLGGIQSNGAPVFGTTFRLGYFSQYSPPYANFSTVPQSNTWYKFKLTNRVSDYDVE